MAEELPEFPLFDCDGIESTFGCGIERYISYGGRQDSKSPCRDLERALPAEAQAASMLFYQGGRLSDYGFQVKAGLDRAKVHSALRGLLCSFEPSHEQKIGTAALAIHRWCDPVASADQSNAA